MTGYPPQAGPPAGYPAPNPQPRRSGRPMSVLSPFDLVVAGCALLCFIFAFMPWFGVDVGGASTTFSGWDFGLGTTGVVLLVLAGIVALVPLLEPAGDGAAAQAASVEDRKAENKKVASPTAAVLALVGAIVIVVQIGRGAGALFDIANVHLTRQWGLILVVVLGVIEVVAAVIGWLRTSGRLAVRPKTPSPYQQAWGDPGYPPGYQQAQGTYPPYGYPQGYQQPSAPGGYPQPTAYGQPPAGARPPESPPGGYPPPQGGYPQPPGPGGYPGPQAPEEAGSAPPAPPADQPPPNGPSH